MQNKSRKQEIFNNYSFSKNKRGNLLQENFIFLALNLFFLMIVMLFVSRQGNGAIVLEQSYAKNIALLIDSAKPVESLTLSLEMKDAFDLARKNNVPFDEIVTISENIVTVKLSSEGGYQYSFFNNVEVTAYPDSIKDNPNHYIIKIHKYN